MEESLERGFKNMTEQFQPSTHATDFYPVEIF